MRKLHQSVLNKIAKDHPEAAQYLIGIRHPAASREPLPAAKHTVGSAARIAGWAKYARECNGPLETRDQPLEMWLPDLKLHTANRMIGSDSMHAQSHAKKTSRAAVFQFRGPVWKFASRVHLFFLQELASGAHTMDTDNLWTKHVQDALCDRDGIGILPHDGQEVVGPITRDVRVTGRLGVRVFISPLTRAFRFPTWLLPHLPPATAAELERAIDLAMEAGE
jgi:hypothetical protein